MTGSPGALVSPDRTTTVLRVHEGSGAPMAEADLAGWVLGEGRDLDSLVELFDHFCRRLAGNGVPVWRATLHGFTLHPQMRGMGLRWWRDKRIVEEFAVGFGAESDEEFAVSPIWATVTKGEVQRYPPGDPGWHRLPLLRRLASFGANDYFALPLGRFNTRSITATFTTTAPLGFTAEQVALIAHTAPALGAVVEARLLKRVAVDLLDTYLGQEAGHRVFSGEIRRGQGAGVHAVVMATDLREFTHLSDLLPPGDIIELLDEYFECVHSAVRAQDGEVLKFIGDGVLSIFRANADHQAEAARRAIASARQTLGGLEQLNRMRAWAERPVLKAGVGLHVGDVFFGNVGAQERLDFTVIGATVNLAFRLESLTKLLGRSIVTSKAFADAVPDQLTSLGFQRVRGIVEPVEVFGLIDGVPSAKRPSMRAQAAMQFP